MSDVLKWKESIMQASQVKQEFPRIEQMIDNAAQLCQTSGNVPDELRNCLSELDRESDQTMQMLEQEQEQNDSRIIECVDRLEKLGDRAMQACRQAGNIDQGMQQAVQEAHDAISDLKHRLH
jgi:conjugal transfer/entry exclusion protein